MLGVCGAERPPEGHSSWTHVRKSVDNSASVWSFWGLQSLKVVLFCPDLMNEHCYINYYVLAGVCLPVCNTTQNILEGF